MRRRLWWMLLACLTVAWIGCSKKKEGDEAKKEAPAREEARKDEPRPDQPRPPEQPQQLNTTTYKKLWLDLATCKFTKWGIDSKCPAFQAINEAQKNKNREKDFWKKVGVLARELIKHTSPQVRYFSAQSMDSFFVAGQEKANFVVSVAKTEKDPMVLKKMISVVGSSSQKNPAVAELLLSMADNANEIVRKEAINWLASSWAKGVKGALEKVMEKIEKDPSEELRSFACRYAYKHEDERIIPIYQKYTKDPVKMPKMADGCMEGLFNLWNAYIHMTKPSKKAYDLTLKLMRKKPRTDRWPSWTLMDDFGRVPLEETADKQKVIPKWYNKKAVIQVMVDVAKDKAYNWLGRTGAVQSLAGLGAVAELEKLKKDIEKAKDDKNVSYVVKRIDKELPKAKEQAAKAGGSPAAVPPAKGKRRKDKKAK